MRDLYRELFELSADAILIIEGDKFTDCNSAAVKMLRYTSKQEVLQMHPSKLSPPKQPDGQDSFEKANAMIATAFERGSHRFEWNHKRADGQVFPVEVLLTAIQEPGRRTLHVVWRDITERRLLEDELRQALKMEAIGKLSGGIAHDFNNILVSVLGHADFLSRLLEHSPQAMEHVREIRSAGEKAAALVRQLLAFGRKQQLLPVVLDLNKLTLTMQKLIEGLIGDSVTLVITPSARPALVKADRSQIEQVLLNLAANARDAMDAGGYLTIKISHTELKQARPSPQGELPAGEYAVLSVKDSGTGMDALTARRAFDPFFTTKEVGRGTGLGLATVYGIVKQSGGSVSLESAVGRGATVEILLPLVSDPVKMIKQESPLVEAEFGSGETILVAEDEKEVSTLVRRALEARGFKVLVCGDGLEAMNCFEEHCDEVALLITDVIMPKMSGPELVARLKRNGHHPRVLFMSGYMDEGLSQVSALDKEAGLLEKPFGVQELLSHTQRALGIPL